MFSLCRWFNKRSNPEIHRGGYQPGSRLQALAAVSEVMESPALSADLQEVLQLQVLEL